MKKQLSPILLVAIVLPALALADGDATRPAATQPAAVPWAVKVPGTNLTVTVQRPADWKESKYSDGQPFIFKPGAGAGAVEASWEFDMKHGTSGRSIDQVLDQIAGATAKQDKTTVTKKEVVKRPDGSKAGVIEYKSTAGGTESTAREYFFAIDADSLLVITELAVSPAWKQDADALAGISASVKVGPSK